MDALLIEQIQAKIEALENKIVFVDNCCQVVIINEMSDNLLLDGIDIYNLKPLIIKQFEQRIKRLKQNIKDIENE